MLAVNATAAISSKTVTINTNGITYQVDMTVKYYYNGSRVWVTQAYSGYTGYQTCFVKYSTAPNWITITGCSDTGGVTTRTLRADWDNMQYNLYTYHRYMILKPKSNGTYTTAFG